MKAVKKSSQRILYSRGDDKNKNKIGFETAMTKRIKTKCIISTPSEESRDFVKI